MNMSLPFRLKAGDRFWEHVLKPYLFRKDAEEAHLFTVRSLLRMQQMGLLPLLRYFYRSPLWNHPLDVFGTPWINPVGLAAGFDKQGEVVPALQAIGFGSVQVGTITYSSQEGNKQPRVFRYPQKNAIINSYGFNSQGAVAVRDRILNIRKNFQINIPIGFSLGKDKNTSVEFAVRDYIAAYRILYSVMSEKDYIIVNISSPNTPILKKVFGNPPHFLAELMRGIQCASS